MRSGRLRQRALIESPPTSRTSSGQVDPEAAWTEVLAGWRCNVEPVTGREAVVAGQPQPDVTHRVTGRRPAAALTPGMRLTIGTRVLHIRYVLDVESRGKEALLYCTERT